MSGTKPVQHMTLKQFQDHLHQYDNDFLICRDMRHVWSLTQPYEKKHTGWVTKVLTCDRCHTTRTDVYAIVNNMRLVKSGSAYSYPEGFRIKGLPNVQRVSEITRFEAFIRAQQEQEQEAQRASTSKKGGSRRGTRNA